MAAQKQLPLIHLFRQQLFIFEAFKCQEQKAATILSTPVPLDVPTEVLDVFFLGDYRNVHWDLVAHVLDGNRAVLSNNENSIYPITVHAYMQAESTAEALLNDRAALIRWTRVQPTATLINIGCQDILSQKWVLPKGSWLKPFAYFHCGPLVLIF